MGDGTMRNLLLVLALGGTLAAQNKLEDVLNKMDATGAKFQGAEANVKYTTFTKVVNKTEKQSGGLYLKKEKGGYKVLIEFRSADRQSILMKGDSAWIYH